MTVMAVMTVAEVVGHRWFRGGGGTGNRGLKLWKRRRKPIVIYGTCVQSSRRQRKEEKSPSPDETLSNSHGTQSIVYNLAVVVWIAPMISTTERSSRFARCESRISSRIVLDHVTRRGRRRTPSGGTANYTSRSLQLLACFCGVWTAIKETVFIARQAAAAARCPACACQQWATAMDERWLVAEKSARNKSVFAAKNEWYSISR